MRNLNLISLARFFVIAILCMFFFAINQANADDSFPNKPISLIMPVPPGGPTDTQFRALARIMEKNLGQSVIIVNKPGAAATLGPSTMAQSAAADGYTVSVILASLFRMPNLVKVNYDPIQDFSYIINLTGFTNGIVVSADSPWQNLKELLDHAKANPGKLSYGATGNGSAGHIAMARLAKAVGAELNFVPFKGGAEEMSALLGGHIDAVSDPGWGPLAEAGRIRVLATLGDQRIERWNHIPTLTEMGYDITVHSPVGIAGPKGMDPKVIQKLHDAFKQAMESQEYLDLLAQNDQEIIYMDSNTYSDYVAKQTKLETQFVKELGLDLN